MSEINIVKHIELPIISEKKVDETNVEWMLNNGQAVLYLMRNRDRIQSIIDLAVNMSNMTLEKEMLKKL